MYKWYFLPGKNRLSMANVALWLCPPRNTVCYYYRKWKNNGFIEEVHEALCNKIRVQSGWDKSPGLGLIESRSVKTSRNGGSGRWIDGGKKIKGRK
jgi:hypothetical protein